MLAESQQAALEKSASIPPRPASDLLVPVCVVRASNDPSKPNPPLTGQAANKFSSDLDSYQLEVGIGFTVRSMAYRSFTRKICAPRTLALAFVLAILFAYLAGEGNAMHAVLVGLFVVSYANCF